MGDRIADQIDDDLPQPSRIPHQTVRHVRRDFVSQLQILGVGPQAKRAAYPRSMWDDRDVNSFGTDEYLAYSKRGEEKVAGTVVEAGQPLCTIQAESLSRPAVLALIKQRSARPLDIVPGAAIDPPPPHH